MRLGPSKISEIDDWLVLEIRELMSFIHCEFWDHFPCDFIHDSSSAVNFSIVAKEIHTLLYNATLGLEDQWELVEYNNLIYKT